MMENIPVKHTAAIMNNGGYNVLHSGNMAEMRKAWDNLPFEQSGGLFSLVARAIDNKWYRINWMVF